MSLCLALLNYVVRCCNSSYKREALVMNIEGSTSITFTTFIATFIANSHIVKVALKIGLHGTSGRNYDSSIKGN